jgi:UDP-glucose 6-dehydrogenase
MSDVAVIGAGYVGPRLHVARLGHAVRCADIDAERRPADQG